MILPAEARSLVGGSCGSTAASPSHRASFDAALQLAGPPYPMRDRFTGEVVLLDAADFADLCRLHLFDWLE